MPPFRLPILLSLLSILFLNKGALTDKGTRDFRLDVRNFKEVEFRRNFVEWETNLDKKTERRVARSKRCDHYLFSFLT